MRCTIPWTIRTKASLASICLPPAFKIDLGHGGRWEAFVAPMNDAPQRAALA